MTEKTGRKNCKIRKAKGQIREWLKNNKETIRSIGIIILCLWIVLTLWMWGFTQKTVVVQQCHNITGIAYRGIGYNQITKEMESQTYCAYGWSYGWRVDWDKSPPCPEVQVCNDVSHQEYYTLPEIFKIQVDVIAGAILEMVGWIMSHPVV